MEIPSEDEILKRQNKVYTMDVLEKYRGEPQTATTLLNAVVDAFTLGAGGYDGSLDAAHTLERGGLAVLLDKLGLSDVDKDMLAEIDQETFEAAVGASVGYGASYDDIEREIPPGSICDTAITGDNPFNGPFVRRHVIPLDGSGERPDWRVD